MLLWQVEHFPYLFIGQGLPVTRHWTFSVSIHRAGSVYWAEFDSDALLMSTACVLLQDVVWLVTLIVWQCGNVLLSFVSHLYLVRSARKPDNIMYIHIKRKEGISFRKVSWYTSFKYHWYSGCNWSLWPDGCHICLSSGWPFGDKDGQLSQLSLWTSSAHCHVFYL